MVNATEPGPSDVRTGGVAPRRSPWGWMEQDRHLMRRSMVISIGLHLTVILFLSVALGSSAKPLAVSTGYLVELVDLPEPPEDVRTPRQGAKDSAGEIRLPTDHRKPEAKPRPRKPRETRPKAPPEKKPEEPKPPVAHPPSAAPGAGGRLETEVPFPFDYYTEAITRLIFSRWAPLAGTPDSTRVVVHFFILRDGSVSRLEVLEPSGISAFDRGAISAVRDVGKFPELPQGFGGSRLGVKFHFEYRRDLL